MEFESRILLIAKIAQLVPDIGKTAMMKCIYLLNELEKVPTGYTYEIYTYGPYSSEVMEEIDFAQQNGYITVEGISFTDGKYGYYINCSESAERSLSDSHLLDEYIPSIDKVTSEFGQKTAKSLELIATIVYVDVAYLKAKGRRESDAICALVHKIKPHFTLDMINSEYQQLERKGLLQSAIA